MRPGQAAPVFIQINAAVRFVSFASMRPGQAAPVFRSGRAHCGARSARFNEAGAGCPGILKNLCEDAREKHASMRPGQAAPVFENAPVVMPPGFTVLQ